MGVEAVQRLVNGETGIMVGRQGRDQVSVPLEEVTTRMRSISQDYYEMAEILSR